MKAQENASKFAMLILTLLLVLCANAAETKSGTVGGEDIYMFCCHKVK